MGLLSFWKETKEGFDNLELQIDMQREEVRAIFALGVIGTLLTIRDLLSFPIFGVPIQNILAGLIFGWGTYVFLMALAVSSDWTGEGVAKLCYLLAYCTFVSAVAGIFGTLAIVELDFLLSLLFPTFPNQDLVIAIIVGLIFFWLGMRFTRGSLFRKSFALRIRSVADHESQPSK
jgi:hypothetical protein